MMKPRRSTCRIPHRMTTLSILLLAAGLFSLPETSLAQTKNKAAAPIKPSTAGKEFVQVVKPPIALAYIDVATSGSDMPGGNLMAGAAQGAQSGGGLFGALTGMAKGAMGGASDRGNVFGSTHSLGFVSGKFLDISVYTSKNPGLSEAKQFIPNVMNLGESLQLNAPVPEKIVHVPVDETPVEPTYEKPKGKISVYWGCGETIRPGQPRTLDVATASMDDYAKFFVMRGKTTKGARWQPGHPAWPNKVDDRKVPDTASLVGQHNFVGNGIPESFKVSLAAPQDLMPSIELKQTKKDGAVALDWKSIPHARGYFVTVMGGKSDGSAGENASGEMIVWTSSELADLGFGLMDYQSNQDIDKWIKEKVILSANATQCAVPKGIFPDGGAGMLRMIAYGSDAYFSYPPRPEDPKIAWEPDWQTKVRVKSVFGSILGGMGDMGEKPQPKKEEKKNKATDLLKSLFGN
ncbi:hypothetical protein [Undibacterium sp. Ji22W]|uniref:hypothetical protein n=1 Tax=Undibacterium sp. Ji22W TaxID=3413038 RepID=UPI003BF3FDC6